MSSQKQFQLMILRCILGLAVVAASFSYVSAQTPFEVDDVDVVEKGHFHLELLNEFDGLQRSEFPSLKQNTAVIELDYGLFKDLEVGIGTPSISIFHATGSDEKRTVSGIGDINLVGKWNFLKEKENSKWPAMSIALNLQLPTGSTERDLGSGLVDFYGNGVLQKSLTKKTTLRLNGGILFAGNAATGELGIRTRGIVFTGGISVVKQVTPRLDLGAQFAGALTKSFQLGAGEFETTFGGNYAIHENFTIDFGVIVGKFAAPRAGVKLGFSWDF